MEGGMRSTNGKQLYSLFVHSMNMSEDDIPEGLRSGSEGPSEGLRIRERSVFGREGQI